MEEVVELGWGGIENLALIPGTVGAAPIQHIAAYGQNLKDVFVSLDALQMNDGSARSFKPQHCRFAYRDSVFRGELRGRYIVTAVRLRLMKQPVLVTSYNSRHGSLEDELARIASRPYTVRDVYRAVVDIRRRKLPDPAKVGSAGSFFKNPVVHRTKLLELRQRFPDLQVYPAAHLLYPGASDLAVEAHEHFKVPAGWLLEGCGLKGLRHGRCGLWPHQSLSIVNYGGASPQEILNLIELVRRRFFDEYGILLENEVEIV